jgi:hypothetical protein
LDVIGGDPSVMDKAVPPTDPTQPVNFQDLVTAWTGSIVNTPALIGTLLQPLSHVAPVTHFGAIDAALFSYLNDSVGASASVHWDTAGLPRTQCAITIGQGMPSPPTEPTKAAQPMYWIVMADDAGEITFNDNALSQDPDDLDALIEQAQDAVGDQRWWTAFIVSDNDNPISQKAQQWLTSCGMSFDETWHTYPQAPGRVVGVGRANMASFPGQLTSALSPGGSPSFSTPTLQVSVPLHAAQVGA